MESRITIEVDFDNSNEPYIKILNRSSEDVRDKLLKNFIEKLTHQSTWCKIEFVGEHEYRIRPIPFDKLKEQSELMSELSKT